MPLIRYQLEEMERKWWEPPAALNSELASIDSLAKKAREHCADFIEHKMPYFHPGRVLVSNEVMSRIGRREVLFHLNCLVRGCGCDGAFAGEYIQACFVGGLLMRSHNPLTESIELCITINAARTCTVIRFNYERLHYRRRITAISSLESQPGLTAAKKQSRSGGKSTLLKKEPDQSGQKEDLLASIVESIVKIRRETGSSHDDALRLMLMDLMFWCERHKIDFRMALDHARKDWLDDD